MILTFDNVNFFFKFIRQFLASIDVVVFSLLSWMLEGAFNLSSLMLSADFAKQIYTRVYIILGVFMAFKLTFSFLKYLVSPDAMTDKEQGVGKLVGRVVAMIIMLIAFPIVFFNPVPGDSQNRTVLAILQDGVVKTLPRIILGQAIDDTNASGSVNAKGNGKELALSMLKSFYYPSVCNEDSKNYDKNQSTECQKYFAGEQASISSKDDLDPSGINSFKAFNDSIINEGSGGDYAYQYMWPLTTVAGILLIVIMAGICIDIAIRCFKLLILEVMAPVPIMTYIDPKASKDGSFAAWSKTLISTYIDLFVKLGTVYLVLLLANALFRKELFDKAAYNNFSGLSYLYVQVFLVIGLFQFAKQAPKFIKDALGIKDSGGGFMDSLKTLGAAAGLAGGAIIGGAAGVTGGFAAARAAGNNLPMSLVKGLGGGIAGLGRGGINGAKGAGKGNPFAGATSAIAAQSAVTQRKMAAAAGGSTLLGRTGARFDQLFKGQTAADRDKEKLDEYKEAIDGVKEFKSVLSDAANKSDAIIGGTNLKQFKGTLAAANAGDKTALNELVKYGFGRTITTTKTTASGKTITTHATVGDLSAANAGAAKFEKDWQSSYYGEVSNGNITDGDASAVMSAKSVADAGISNLQLSDGGTVISEVTADNAGKVIGAATRESNTIVSSGAYKANQANAAAIKKS